ncbi:MAG: hypothetical protein JST00_36940 [Deltaproteobacteria bacterium]|nr:hypothetical protein [Deltaproteobacteria bacterium]
MMDPSDPRLADVKLAGYFVASVAQAFVHLRMLGGPEVETLCAGVEPTGHYPYPRFAALLATVEKRFKDMEPVLEQLGMQMMTDWYEHGPGKGIVTRGVGFLEFQTGSQGYRSVVSGPDSAIGAFTLVALDEKAGTARLKSTTPFPKTMERGILVGGMRAPGDLTYVDAINAPDPQVFDVTFR